MKKTLYIIISLIIIGAVFAVISSFTGEGMVEKRSFLGGVLDSLKDNDGGKETEPIQTIEKVSGRELNNKYVHNDPKFSFFIPDDYVIVSRGEDEGEMILLSKEGGSPSIQLYITAFDEDIVLTADRIREDVPVIIMEDEKQVEIGRSVQGVLFGEGDKLNVWFIYKNFLYQLSGLRSDTDLVAKMVSSFKF